MARYEKFAWTVLIAAVVGDIVTTMIGLRLGMGEANPFMLHAMGALGPLTALVVTKLALLVFVAAGRRIVVDRWKFLIPIGAAIPTTIAVLTNSVGIATILL